MCKLLCYRVVALCKLLQYAATNNDKRINEIMVEGDEVVTSANGIRTRSKGITCHISYHVTFLTVSHYLTCHISYHVTTV